MSHLRRLWKRIVTFVSILNQTAGLLSAILTTLGFLGLGTVALGYVNNILPLAITGGVILVLSILLFIFLYTFIIETRKRASSPDASVYPPPVAEEELELLLKEIVYQYFPDGKTMRQRKRFKVRVLRNGITQFTDRYRWTGTGTCIIKSLTPGFSITNQRKEEFWDYYDVRFPHPLRKDEFADFVVEWELSDERGNAVPFLSTMIDFETRHLLMQVILPPESAPKRAYCYEFANYLDTLPAVTQETYWDPATQSITYDVPHPQKYRKYLIRWYTD